MPVESTDISNLPPATDEAFRRHLNGRRLAVFSDYDGVLTPIVDRPEDAVISPRMRDVVTALSQRCSVCVVSGRDRKVVQQLMGVESLVVAGSHGFDIWSPGGGLIQHDEGTEQAKLIASVADRLTEEVGDLEGVLVEPKRVSVAVHYRLADEDGRARVKACVDELLAAHPDELKMTPGKMVYELQPAIDWDKGKAVLYLLEALELDGDQCAALYLGDDVTDEHAFAALAARTPNPGIGVFVGRADDPEVAGRRTAAEFRLDSVEDVAQFLDGLARSPETGGSR